MEGYDLALVGNLIAQPAFQKKFGHFVSESAGYQVPAAWQSGLAQAANMGSMVGIFIAAPCADRWGYKKTTLGGLVAMNALILVMFFAENLSVLLAGQFLCALPWGAFVACAPAYASEVAPLRLRNILTLYIQFCWTAGQFVSVLSGKVGREGSSKWAYKVPIAIQWAWPGPLLIILLFAPESPWWLTRKRRFTEAEKSAERLGGKQRPINEHMAYMMRTIATEEAEENGVKILDVFKGVDLRRTLIVCLIHASAYYTGLVLGLQSTYFFQQAGLSTNSSFALSMGNFALQVFAVLLSFVLTTYVGRRTIWLAGTGFNTIMLFVIAIINTVAKKENTGASWGQAVLCIFVFFSYGLCLGPIIWVTIAETSSIRLRSLSVGLSRVAYYILSIPAIILNNYMLNPDAWNLSGKCGYFWGGTCAVLFIVSYFCFPELKDRSYREIDILFHRKVSSRKFASTKLELTDDE
ncbi:hypothetical protein VHUM_02057 [Vanrija humicola]|uniref:Major facilitator superfamily (MFS) profile domain-containing protein n=1 Tax=Vanrija humicola TaxID=5417 RepID=A0A7D8UZH5_VANHU|nr:hypothetical protein VHUM_02057 [Vanrija humicola]